MGSRKAAAQHAIRIASPRASHATAAIATIQSALHNVDAGRYFPTVRYQDLPACTNNCGVGMYCAKRVHRDVRAYPRRPCSQRHPGEPHDGITSKSDPLPARGPADDVSHVMDDRDSGKKIPISLRQSGREGRITCTAGATAGKLPTVAGPPAETRARITASRRSLRPASTRRWTFTG